MRQVQPLATAIPSQPRGAGHGAAAVTCSAEPEAHSNLLRPCAATLAWSTLHPAARADSAGVTQTAALCRLPLRWTPAVPCACCRLVLLTHLYLKGAR